MMKSGALPFLALAVLFPASAEAASFDCAKAEHPLEKTVCANPPLSKLDEEIAAAYRKGLDMFFDKKAYREQQNAWQKSMRAQCNTTCPPFDDVEIAYIKQLEFLEEVRVEVYSANYKTSDIASLTVTHIDKDQFEIAINRAYLDEQDGQEETSLCDFPLESELHDAVAKMSGPDKASWTNGKCTLDFIFKRDAQDFVYGIDLQASEECRSYCRNNFGLGDNYIPDNDWTSGGQ